MVFISFKQPLNLRLFILKNMFIIEIEMIN
jgi:hypothetical protein